MREQVKHSCVDCGTKNCNLQEGTYPPFCVSQHMDPQVKEKAMAHYEEDNNKEIMNAAAMVEYEGYCKWPRVKEIIEFAKRMNYQKLGIATCVGLLSETRTLANILRSHGFEVFGIGCKAGEVLKTDVGIDPVCNGVGHNMCNPILQAETLNANHTELNIVMGLCVGHDSLFYKYSEAIVTTLVTKDRVTGHNPAAPLYQADGYYHSLYGDQ